jgi:chromosomal replication initiation ATPase DnaA
MMYQTHAGELSPEKVIGIVCQSMQITRDELIHGGRYRKFSDPRACTSRLLFDLFKDLAPNEIGDIIERDRTTVLAHFKKIKRCKEVKDMFTELKKSVESNLLN